jgi:hypothetical protein
MTNKGTGKGHGKSKRVIVVFHTHRKLRDEWGTRGIVAAWRRQATAKAMVLVKIEIKKPIFSAVLLTKA